MRNHWLWGAFLCEALFIGAWKPAAAQEACVDCLTLTRVVELSSAAGTFVPSARQFVARSGNGDFIVSHLWLRPPQIAIYDVTGQFKSLYGASGRGPGEMQYSPFLFRGIADTLYAFDAERLVRFDGDLNVIDTRNLPVRTLRSTMAVLPSGNLVIDASIPIDAASAYTVAILSPDLEILKPMEPVARLLGPTLIARSSDGGFWTLRSNDLQLRKYSGAGELQRSVRIADERFEVWDTRVQGEAYTVPPRSTHAALVELESGHLLVLTWIADPEWAPVSPERRRSPSTMTMNAIYDTVLNLVDPGTGAILSRYQSDPTIGLVRGDPNLLFSIAEVEFGHFVTAIWRVNTRSER